jgi:hypothetical protein
MVILNKVWTMKYTCNYVTGTNIDFLLHIRSRCGHDRMVVGFTTIYAISCLSPLKLWVRTTFMERCFDTTVCDKVCQWLATCQWFSPGISVSSTNKTDCHEITEICLKVTFNTKPIINKVCVFVQFIKCKFIND